MKKLAFFILLCCIWQAQAAYFNETVAREVPAPEHVLGFHVTVIIAAGRKLK
ncbi:hypothetical protein [Alishewanella longhuensis]